MRKLNVLSSNKRFSLVTQKSLNIQQSRLLGPAPTLENKTFSESVINLKVYIIINSLSDEKKNSVV